MCSRADLLFPSPVFMAAISIMGRDVRVEFQDE
jgi:hypothetical protein